MCFHTTFQKAGKAVQAYLLCLCRSGYWPPSVLLCAFILGDAILLWQKPDYVHGSRWFLGIWTAQNLALFTVFSYTIIKWLIISFAVSPLILEVFRKMSPASTCVGDLSFVFDYLSCPCSLKVVPFKHQTYLSDFIVPTLTAVSTSHQCATTNLLTVYEHPLIVERNKLSKVILIL